MPPVESGSTPASSASRFATVDLPLPISPAMVILNGMRNSNRLDAQSSPHERSDMRESDPGFR
jgi:hypothetical protein